MRARDVQILFADASTGARSPAMVRQGQIGEIIAAKPQARRRILEEAAGIAGLHSRRHEAELRLKAAEDNLARLDDVLDADRRRRPTACGGRRGRPRAIAPSRPTSAAPRRSCSSSAWRDVEAELAEARAQARRVDIARGRGADARAGGGGARRRRCAAAALPALREAEARAGAALQRLVLAREALDGEERRAKERGPPNSTGASPQSAPDARRAKAR